MFKLLSIFFVQAVLISRLLGQDLFEQSNDLLVREIDDTYRTGPGFLAGSQNERGCWSDSSYGSEPGVGMCILAFLARGDDPNSTLSKPLQKGLDFLLKARTPRPDTSAAPCTITAFPPSFGRSLRLDERPEIRTGP